MVAISAQRKLNTQYVKTFPTPTVSLLLLSLCRFNIVWLVYYEMKKKKEWYDPLQDNPWNKWTVSQMV